VKKTLRKRAITPQGGQEDFKDETNPVGDIRINN
jgi:hypothetical protein